MIVSGFTFIRNAVLLDYPAVEAISAVLPIVDEFIVNIGRMQGEEDDGTLEYIRSINSPKIRIIESIWNPHLTKGGYVYAQQSNVALFNCQGEWAVYVQCDEVIHEHDHDLLRDAMTQYRDNIRVDALTLWQENFWGDYKTRFCIPPWTGRRKCWVVKPHHFVLSRGDAANFTVHPKFKERGRKVHAVQTAARQFHYGSVRSLKALEANDNNRRRYWTNKQIDIERLTDEIYYSKHPCQFFSRYKGTHPSVMNKRINDHSINIDLDSTLWRTKLTWSEQRRIFKGWLKNHIKEPLSKYHSDYVLVGKHS